MDLHITNTKSHLSTLTLPQLRKELKRVETQYQGWQVNCLSDASLKSWHTHLALIDEEIERRG